MEICYFEDYFSFIKRPGYFRKYKFILVTVVVSVTGSNNQSFAKLNGTERFPLIPNETSSEIKIIRRNIE